METPSTRSAAFTKVGKRQIGIALFSMALGAAGVGVVLGILRVTEGWAVLILALFLLGALPALVFLVRNGRTDAMPDDA